MALLAACSAQSPPPPAPPKVGVVTLRAEPVELTADLPGRVAAAETSEVRPQINGVIRARLFTEGSMVRAGQVLYEIEDAAYRAALGTAQGNLARAEATIGSTTALARRYRGLVDINAVSQQELDNADAAARQARADAAAQRSGVQAARVNLDFTRIRAPISGRIGRSFYTRGALVQSGQADALATIMRTDTVYVDVTQSAAQLLDLKDAIAAGGLSNQGRESARVRLILPNGKTYPIEGRLEFSEVAVDPQTGSVTLRATFPNPQGLLLPGMFVRARLVEGVRQNAILAPQQGITRDPRGRATALVVDAANTVVSRRVIAERPVGDKWVVTSGLAPGDRLIVEGLVAVKPGMKVSVGKPAQVTAAPGAGR
ncbi:efflux RND transporter periplasmic adaptor subunit [Novosphingobium sp. H3SJ31-1]|uniref:Efflux RND transporter periplasmic adaptor subunit n=2 Tax=Novosphingobium album (ex Liu et al. 2023) TaxID=3031130 RepID=A0ABT5WSU1_9SPHN|nr:efflux RND transporter periplasmic adaptor subunit [Novosphingobium album (ex Liu et al. 2023)]MDE8653121.1 efflux RND transporter periplasmic adaptor subunit [Novosphingobium album (ex Liu et al. 2023)]